MLDEGINPDLLAINEINCIEKTKNESEKKARKNIKYFIENRYKINLHLEEIDTFLNINDDYNDFTQILLWINTAVLNLKNSYKTVNLGILATEFVFLSDEIGGNDRIDSRHSHGIFRCCDHIRNIR